MGVRGVNLNTFRAGWEITHDKSEGGAVETQVHASAKVTFTSFLISIPESTVGNCWKSRLLASLGGQFHIARQRTSSHSLHQHSFLYLLSALSGVTCSTADFRTPLRWGQLRLYSAMLDARCSTR